MKIVRFQHHTDAADEAPHVGLLRDDGVVNIAAAIYALPAATPQQQMESLIDNFEALRPALEQILEDGPVTPLDEVRVATHRCRALASCSTASATTGSTRSERLGQLNMFLKSPDAVIGDGDTVVLPNNTSPYMFQHEAELGIVFKGPAKDVSQADWQERRLRLHVHDRRLRPCPGPAARGAPVAGWASPSTPSARSAPASPRRTRSRSPTTSGSSSGTTANYATTTSPTTWSTAYPSSSSSRPTS